MAKSKVVEDRDKRFEELLTELEQVVSKLENAEPDLEEAIRSYERGMELSKECHKRLDDAERKIKLLRKKADGTMEETDFPNSEGEA